MPLPDPTRRAAEECARLASLPVQHAHAAGIDVGDSTHWVCVDSTPDGVLMHYRVDETYYFV